MQKYLPSLLPTISVKHYFSRWDLLALPLIFGALFALDYTFSQSSIPFLNDTPDLTIDLDPWQLPYYAFRSTMRMLLAVIFSLIFTFGFATLAARSKSAERILIPILDFLQSLPILGFLTITTTFFLGLFQGSALGLEAVSIFAIFTSQAWNMAFSFYASLTSLPSDLVEVSAQLKLSAWQRFWKLEVPYATPNLLWNTMMSVSGGWFFVVASEVITITGREKSQYLPGLGAYIGQAIADANVSAMLWATLALLITILLYDQLIFRPIIAWAEKFKFEQSKSEVVPISWMLTIWQRAKLTQLLFSVPAKAWESFSLMTARHRKPKMLRHIRPVKPITPAQSGRVVFLVTAVASLYLAFILLKFIFGSGLGFANGHMLDSNPDLNTDAVATVSQSYADAGVTVGDDKSVLLSDICQAYQTVSANSSQATTINDLVKQSDDSIDLTQACHTPMVEAHKVSWQEVPHLLLLGLYTLLRVVVMVALATLFWLPIGVWIGLRPKLATRIQPLVQFMAAFPSNLVFPCAVILISYFHIAPWILLTPLLVLGTQWYILFNVIAGTMSIPSDLKEAAKVQGLSGSLLWKKLYLPAIFPATVTGGITASGGSWNASIVSEVVTWGTLTYTIAGLGAYIAKWSTGSFNPHVAIGMALMGIFVLLFNRLLWRRLYNLAETRYRLN